MRKEKTGHNSVFVPAVFLGMVILAGYYLGFDSRGALSDRSLIIGEPVAEGIVAVHDFSVPYSQAEITEMENQLELTIPVYLRRDRNIAEEVSSQIEDLIQVTMGQDAMAEYFAGRVRALYVTGLVDLQELRNSYSGSLAVVEGLTRENISELFTVQEARDGIRLDLQRRGIPEEKIPQILEMIVPDITIDEAARDSVVQAAVAAVPRNLRVFTTGEEILPPGGLFTDEISRYWNAMVVSPSGSNGLIEHNAAKTAIASLLIILAFLYIYFTSAGTTTLNSVSEILLLFTAWAVTLLLTVFLARSGVSDLSLFTFTMLGAGITAVFFDSGSRANTVHYSWFLAAVFSVMFALQSPHPMTTFLMSFIPACFVSILIRDLKDSGVSYALLAGSASSVLVFWLLSSAGSSGSRQFTTVIWLLLVGMPIAIIGMIRVLIHPMEILFGMATPLTYQRLNSDLHPLREELKNRAGGTYVHSLIVSDMAARAAEAVGARVELAKLGGIFHDIGKLSNPGMFIENIKDPDRNSPHNSMSPEESARAIISHVSDGVKLARKYHLPSEIRDIIYQHHGDSSARYFLEKARRELPPGAELDESIYHYNCPKPQSLEAALVMLADSVSSAVKGLGKDASNEQKAATVTRIMEEKASSGQFDDCNFPPSDRRKAAHFFLDVLETNDHERVKNYPHGN